MFYLGNSLGGHPRLVLSVGVLHSWRYHCERCSGRACEEPYLCCLRILHDQFHLPRHCRLDLGWWLAFQDLRRGLYGFCRCKNVLERSTA